ncbi:MAG: DUF4922 domain-containing protein [Arenicellales bacterium]|nr:DUF4922 domain-containing protein [Arenicellales bacterium]
MNSGELWQAVVIKTRKALASKALHPIKTTQAIVEDGGIPFSIRCVSSLLRKDSDTRTKQRSSQNRANPFLPPERPLTVADISDTHVAVLNKFNVFEHHLLIVTRQYEHQQTPLTEPDFQALWKCLTDYPSLGFYNGGVVAGASQPHKHLQLVPLPLTKAEAIPVERVLDRLVPIRRFHCLPIFEFAHCFYRFNEFQDVKSAANESLEVYRDMLEELRLGIEVIENKQRLTQPYNLLISREWMMMVPRSTEKFHAVSINALGYAGSFFVRKEEQIAAVKKHGPLQALQSVSLIQTCT